MQVAAGRTAGRAHFGDLLARSDPCADLGRETRQVGVARQNALAMIDLDDIAIARLPADEADAARRGGEDRGRSEEHTSELQSLMRNSYAVFCLKKKKKIDSQTR